MSTGPSRSERLARQRKILAVREVSVKEGAQERATFTEESVPADAVIPRADDVFGRFAHLPTHDNLSVRIPWRDPPMMQCR
jgi:hypothetical protein